MSPTNTTAATKLALLIDGDNVSATYMPFIMREAEKRGTVAIRRIYGQFKSGKMKSWEKHVAGFDLTRVNVSPLTSGKNATDMKLVIEAMDMLHGRQLDGFCIASSDGDFSPLAARIRGNAIAVYGFGAKKAPAGYKAEFDHFYECDTELAAEKREGAARPPAARKPASAPAPKPRAQQRPAAVAAPAKPQMPAAPAKPELPVERVREAIDAAMGENGRAHIRIIGNELSRRIPKFNVEKYGHKSIKTLVATLPDVELIKEGSDTFVRWKQK